VAHFSILASLKPEKTKGKSFNVAGQLDSWSGKWPIICEYFELVGTGPEENSPQPGGYIADHKAQWEELERNHSLKVGSINNNISHPGFQYFIMTLLNFDRHMNMGASQSIGYIEVIGTRECWKTAFDRMRDAKIIP